MDKEIWKPISGYEGRYAVSDMGNVASLWFRNKQTNRSLNQRRILKLCGQPRYMVVTLRKDNRSVTASVHRLVLLAFRGTA